MTKYILILQGKMRQLWKKPFWSLKVSFFHFYFQLRDFCNRIFSEATNSSPVNEYFSASVLSIMRPWITWKKLHMTERINY